MTDVCILVEYRPIGHSALTSLRTVLNFLGRKEMPRLLRRGILGINALCPKWLQPLRLEFPSYSLGISSLSKGILARLW